MLLKRSSELYYYENGFSGEKQIFQEYLCDLKEQHHLADITVLVDYGSNGIEVLESTIFNVDGFMELRKNVVRMMSSLKGFSEATRASLISFYGQDVILRNGVKDMGVEYLSFPNGLYSCLVVTEGWHVQKKHAISGKSLNLLKSFIYQRQLADFHSVGYSYNGYLGIPTRDELIKRLEINADTTGSSILVGLRVANMESLAQKNYQSTNVMSDIINYMLKYYNGNLFALGENRIAILVTGNDVMECIDTFEAHLLRMGELFPEVSYNINIVPVCEDALTVIYEVEYSLNNAAMDTFTVSRKCRRPVVENMDADEITTLEKDNVNQNLAKKENVKESNVGTGVKESEMDDGEAEEIFDIENNDYWYDDSEDMPFK